MHTWHNDVVQDLARAMLALPPDHPAVLALPPEAAESLAWLRKERDAAAELEAMRLRMPRPNYGASIEISRGTLDVMAASARKAFGDSWPYIRDARKRGLPDDAHVTGEAGHSVGSP